jgi:hypothetical protein
MNELIGYCSGPESGGGAEGRSYYNFSPVTACLREVLKRDLILPTTDPSNLLTVNNYPGFTEVIEKYYWEMASEMGELLESDELQRISRNTIKLLTRDIKNENRLDGSNGILPIELVLLTSRNFRPSNTQPFVGSGMHEGAVYVSRDGVKCFSYPDTIYLGSQEDIQKFLFSSLTKHGFTRAECLETARMVIFAHEYGHAVYTALVRKMTLNRLNQTNPTEWFTWKIEEIAEMQETEILRQIHERYTIPAEVIADMEKLGVEAKMKTEIGKERVSNGFLLAALRIILLRRGLSHKQADEIVKGYVSERISGHKDEYLMIEKMCRQKNIKLRDLCNLVERYLPSLDSFAKELFSQYLDSYSAIAIGYDYPLSKAELQDWIKSYSHVYSNTQRRNV